MEERQNAAYAIVGARVYQHPHGLDVRDNIMMAQHNPFRLAGGARCENDRSNIVGLECRTAANDTNRGKSRFQERFDLYRGRELFHNIFQEYALSIGEFQLQFIQELAAGDNIFHVTLPYTRLYRVLRCGIIKVYRRFTKQRNRCVGKGCAR